MQLVYYESPCIYTHTDERIKALRFRYFNNGVSTAQVASHSNFYEERGERRELLGQNRNARTEEAH